jgi:hypothetical protein
MLSLLASLATPPPSSHILLHAPFTPFTAAGAVDVSVVPSLAKQAAAFGGTPRALRNSVQFCAML